MRQQSRYVVHLFPGWRVNDKGRGNLNTSQNLNFLNYPPRTVGDRSSCRPWNWSLPVYTPAVPMPPYQHVPLLSTPILFLMAISSHFYLKIIHFWFIEGWSIFSNARLGIFVVLREDNFFVGSTKKKTFFLSNANFVELAKQQFIAWIFFSVYKKSIFTGKPQACFITKLDKKDKNSWQLCWLLL